MGLSILLFTLITLAFLGYYQANRTMYVLSLFLLLIFSNRIGVLGHVTSLVCAGVLWVVAMFWFLPSLRQKLITRYVYRWFQHQIPPMSTTEKEAIEAGDTWWEANLFRGDTNWHEFLSLPEATLSQAEQAFLDNEVNTLCAKIDDWQTTFQDANLSQDVWDYLKNKGFFGMIVPRSYGGLEFSAYAHSCVVSKIASRSLSAAVTSMVPNSLGPAELLIHYGTDAQKDRYLRKLAKGEEIPCFALTAPEAGSDAGAIPDTGIVCKGQYEGKEVIGLSLTWKKRYITLAPIATVLGLAVKVYDPDQLLGGYKDIGITVCLLPTNYPGVKIGRRHFPIDLAFLNGPTEGENVFVPLDFVIGGAPMLGRGWQMLMSCLSAGRGISLPALATATGAMSYFTCGAYARLREQFNVSIGEFEGIKLPLARIGGLSYLLESMRRLMCSAIDMGKKPAIMSAIAKYHMTEIGRVVINDAMDIQGGKGIILGPNNYLARAYEGIPVSITVEGANILTRNLIIFGQGAMRCHPFLQQELASVQDGETNGLHEFDALLLQHGAYFWNRLIRLITLSLTRARFASKPVNDWTGRYFQKLEWMSVALSVSAEVALMLLGGKLKRKESISARLGDILSQLVLASSVLKRYHAGHKDDIEMAHAKWALHDCFNEMQIAFSDFFKNFQPRLISKLLKFITFPLCMPTCKLKDKVSFKIADSMMYTNETRAQQTDLIYVPNENEAIGVLQAAFVTALQAEPIRYKIKAAIKAGTLEKRENRIKQATAAAEAEVISEIELALLQRLEQLRARVIAVDDFDASQLPRK